MIRSLASTCRLEIGYWHADVAIMSFNTVVREVSHSTLLKRFTLTRVRQSLGKQNASRPLIQKGSEAFGHTSGVYLGARVDA